MATPLEAMAKIAVRYKLVTPEQLTDCLRAPIAQRGMLGEVMMQRGLISQAQLDWLKDATAQVLGAQSATPAAAAAATASAPAPATAPTPAPRPSNLAQRERLAELDATNEPALPLDEGSVSAAPSPRQQYRMEHRGDPPQARPAPDKPTVAAPAAPAPLAAPAAPAPRAAPAPAPAMRTAATGQAAAAAQALLGEGVRLRASDIHLHAGLPPMIRVDGVLQLLPGHGPLDPAQTRSYVDAVLEPAEHQRFVQRNDLDFAYTVAGVGRFRANVYRQQRGFDLVFRAIPPQPPTLAQLGLPAALEKFTTFHQGLVLCTGPAGCGKSSTMAALVDCVNRERADHILTIEDPIEFVHASKKCLVRQRQVLSHTESFARALRAALREDPDVIVIGELRDLESIQLALSAAETGHLVLGTLHTNDAIRTINRVLDVFPPSQQAQVRVMFSESLRGVISQRLVRRADGKGRVPVLEVLGVNHAVANLIRDQKQFQIRSVMQMGRSQGMRLFDDSLKELVQSGVITAEEARLQSGTVVL